MNFYGSLSLLQVAGRFSVITDHTRGGRDDGWMRTLTFLIRVLLCYWAQSP